MQLSPNYSSGHFAPHGAPGTADEKLLVFSDRVVGWQLDIAKHLAAQVPHSGYGVMHIITSYFEMIAMYVNGPAMKKPAPGGGQNDWGPRDYFEAGVHLVFPGLKTNPPKFLDQLMTALFKHLRCGLYHQGMTRSRIWLSGQYPEPLRFADLGPGEHVVLINPESLVGCFKSHFAGYVKDVANPANGFLRANFVAMFDRHQSE
jgi:hypothetical protein